MEGISKLCQIAIKASVYAGKAILKVYNKDFEVFQKVDDTPVTRADIKANATIVKALTPTEIPIISEESKIISYDIRKHWKRCWMVDPLDGTREFVDKNGDFTVNIALIEDNKPVFGVIYLPVQRTLYFGGNLIGKSYKLFLNEKLKIDYSKAELLKPIAFVNQSSTVLASRSHINQATQSYLESLKKTQDIQILKVGSSKKFCLLAEGKAQLYPRYGSIMEWDTAAGQAVCESVGIDVLNTETDMPLVYNKPSLKNPSFVAGRI